MNEATIADLVLGRTVFGVELGDLGRYGLLVIMLTMGLSLKPADFSRLFATPVPVLAGLSGQMLFLPIVAFILVAALDPEPHIAVGAILLSCCPGAATSNYFSYLARGDVALSVTLTAISGLLVLTTLPFIVNLGFSLFVDSEVVVRLPVFDTMLQVFQLLIVPVAIGMLLRAWLSDDRANQVQRVASAISFAVMMLIVVMSLTGLWGRFTELVIACGLLALLTNGIAMLAGYASAYVLKLPETQRRALTVEVGIQNFLLAIVLTLTVLDEPDYAIFPVMYLVVMYLSVFAFISWCRFWRDRISADNPCCRAVDP